MLRVDANLRPSSKQLLDMDVVRSKCEELDIPLDDEFTRSSASRGQKESKTVPKL